ncbi:MAG: hypothetical protein J6S95_09640, partial [Lachnospiraceae bacterium]|nr:hypothetical protein [Lachnospiraceae bacterium]
METGIIGDGVISFRYIDDGSGETRGMFGMFINEFVGALVQVLLFSLIPLIFWLIFARRKQNFFK